jgi:hypothetical protein
VRWCDNRRTRTLHSSEREERVGGPYFHLPRNLDTSLLRGKRTMLYRCILRMSPVT